MYIAPDGSYSATYPGAWRRLGAGTIDWALCAILFLLTSIVAGVFQSLGVTSWEAGDLRGIPGSALIALSQVLVAAPVVVASLLFTRLPETRGLELEQTAPE